MNKVNLLQKRVQVKIKYPKSPYKVGEILHEFEYPNGNKYYALSNDSLSISSDEVNECTDIFKVKFWYEERNVEDMPIYVKYESGDVIKTSLWANGHSGVYCKEAHKSYLVFPSESNLLPATEQEYIDYQNTLNPLHRDKQK